MANMTWDRLVEFCRQQNLDIMTKELYAVFSDPVDGLGPVLENVEAHLAYQIKLQNEGIMFAAGPLAAGSEYEGHGIFFYHADSLEQATEIAAADPMHVAGGRTFRVMHWLLNEGDLRV
jgi:hypothetical protein